MMERRPSADHSSFSGVSRRAIIDTWGVIIWLGLLGLRYGIAKILGESKILKMTIRKKSNGISEKKVEPII